jgi:putative DNA primase/helicase
MRQYIDPTTEAQKLIDKHHYVNTSNGLYWYDPDHGLYRSHGMHQIRSALLKALGPHWSQYAAHEIGSYIRSLPYTDENDFDTSPLINLKNGMFNPSTRKLAPHSHIYMSTRQLPVVYEPSARSPQSIVRSFLDRIMTLENSAILCEFLGSALLPELRHKKFLIIQGAPDCGKSKLARLIQYVFGFDNTSNMSLQRLTQDRLAAYRLQKSLINIYPDLTADEFYGPAMKVFTGGDSIYVRGPQQFGHDRVLKTLYIFCCNEIPRAKYFDEALKQRVLILPCRESIPEHERDPDILAKLTTQESLSTMFSFILDGHDYFTRHGFSDSRTSQQALQDYSEYTDDVLAFIKACQRGPRWSSTHTELYSAYAQWCVTGGFKPLPRHDFFRRFDIYKDEFQIQDRVGTVFGTETKIPLFIGIQYQHYT